MNTDPRITEYKVLTQCGRNFIWSALSLDSLLIELTQKGYRATHIEEYKEPVPAHTVQFTTERKVAI